MIYIYEVIGDKLNCEGSYAGSEVLKRFTEHEDANDFKKDWEDLWKKHKDNNECVTPCWYDFRPNLRIEEVEVETEYKSKSDNLESKFDNDVLNIEDALYMILDWNDDEEDQILLDLYDTKSIYKSIDKNIYWDSLLQEINISRYSDKLPMTDNTLLTKTKKFDKELSELLLKAYKDRIKELKK